MPADLIEITKSFVKNTLKNAEGGHDWFHTIRVYNSAHTIAKNEKVIETTSTILKNKKSKPTKKETINSSSVEIIGNSDVMNDVFLKLKKVAPTDANVLVLGENGTGKDLVARALHDNSNRKDKPFVKVDVGALTSSHWYIVTFLKKIFRD